MNFRNNEAALLKNSQSISILDMRVKALEKRISHVGSTSVSMSEDIGKELAEIKENIDGVIESIGTSQNDDKTIFNSLNTIFDNVKDLGNLDNIVKDLGDIKTDLNKNIYSLYNSIYVIHRTTNNLTSMAQSLDTEVKKVFDAVDTLEVYSGKIYNAVDTLENGQKNILDKIDEKTENLTDAINTITTNNTTNTTTITTAVDSVYNRIYNLFGSQNVNITKIYNAVDTLETGQKNILDKIDEKTENLTDAINTITSDNTTNTTTITNKITTTVNDSTTTIKNAVNNVYDRIYNLFSSQNVNITKIYNAVDTLETGQTDIKGALEIIDTVGDSTNEIVNKIHEQLNPPMLTFADIFLSEKHGAYNKDYIPPPNESAESGTSTPYYIIASGGICEFYYVKISNVDANYNQRVDTLRNICKVYRKYKFYYCEFEDVDLFGLFAHNIILESFPVFTDCVFSGEINLREIFKNCTNLSKINDFSTMITSIDKSADEDNTAKLITSLIMDDMFTGCVQFSEIETDGITLASCFKNSKIATISMENMFSCVITIGGILNFNSMFFGSAIKSLNVKNMFSNLKVITSASICVNAPNMFYGCTQLTDIDLSNMFPILSRISAGSESSAVSLFNMFSGCNQIKVINMNIFLKNLICLTSAANKEINYTDMLTGILSENNNKLTFSYSDFIFSNCLGHIKNNTPFDSETITITPTDGGPAGFPYYYEHMDTQDIKNHYNQYDAQARKIITWEWNTATEYNQSTIIIKRY